MYSIRKVVDTHEHFDFSLLRKAHSEVCNCIDGKRT